MNLSRYFVIAAIACIWNAGNAMGQDMAAGEYPTLEYPAPDTYMTPDGGYAYQDAGQIPHGESYPGESYSQGYPGESFGDGYCEPCAQPCKKPSCFKSCLQGIQLGGWAQLGYHTYDSSFRFNNHADRANLHQMWMFAEKSTNGEQGFDFGGRVDYVYGVDAQDTQAFGLDNGHWDTDWDNGAYGFAMPQLYGEVAYGKTSIKFGHFFTLIGYEVVTAPDNFFYSHSYTMYNSEPFTHSGALASHKANDFVTIWAGYSAGWDSGFEDNGDTVLSGMSLVLTDNVTLTYTNTIGRFNESFQGTNTKERGEMHSFVTSSTFGKLNYVLQVDKLDTHDQTDALVRDTLAVNNYFMYQVKDQLAAGLRFEWWNVKRALNENADVYALTFGLNITPQDYLTIRPEIRWDWDVDETPLGINESHPLRSGSRHNQATFGVDAIVKF